MDSRHFSIDDKATEHNLMRLDHLSQQDYSMDERLLDDLIVAVIQSSELLPPAYRRCIKLGSCYTMGTHFGATQERRDAIWSRIRQELNEGLDAVLANSQELRRDAGERPETKGERILKLCEALRDPRNELVTARQLVFVGAGTDVAADARRLVKLFEKKRVANADAHHAEISRLIYHIEIIASRLHHLRV